MESKANRSLRFRINFRREVAAILEQLDAGEGRTEAHVKMPPETRFIQTRAHPPDGMAEKTDHWHARQQFAFPEKQI